MAATHHDVVIVGGGIAGGALATVLGRAGKDVLVLEKTTEYRDVVRGEWIAPWGIVEAKRIGIFDELKERAGGHWNTRHVEFGDGIDPAEAEATAMPLGLLPGIPGPCCFGHPMACNVLNAMAREAGVKVLRGVSDVAVHPGASPSVTYRHDGGSHTAQGRIVVGADGRNGVVRQQLGIELQRGPQHHLFSGMLVEGAEGWPEDLQTMGTQGDVQFLAFPQGQGRVRIYMSWPNEQPHRLSGEKGPQEFLDTFRKLHTVPYASAFANAKPAGPCNAFPNSDTWTDTTYAEGVVLVGDSAGCNDPIIGQGLSITMRDVRTVSEALLGNEDWDTGKLFEEYAAERRERLRRLRFCAEMDALIHAEFGEAALKRRLAVRQKRRSDPAFLLAMAGVMIGPEMLPPEAFDEAVRESVLALG